MFCHTACLASSSLRQSPKLSCANAVCDDWLTDKARIETGLRLEFAPHFGELAVNKRNILGLGEILHIPGINQEITVTRASDISGVGVHLASPLSSFCVLLSA